MNKNLAIDITARLTYGTLFNLNGETYPVYKVFYDGGFILGDEHIQRDGSKAKPYLRSLTTMTEDEKNEVSRILNYEFYVDEDYGLTAEDSRHRVSLEIIQKYIDWLIANQFDYRELIETGEALDAPDGMYGKTAKISESTSNDDALSEDELRKLKHALGFDNKDAVDDVFESYRRCSYYYEADEIWQRLVEKGYARRSTHDGFLYVVTEAGMQAVADATGLIIRFELEFEPKGK